MYFLFFILLLLILFIIMIFNKTAAITFKFNTIQDELFLFFNWFDILKGNVHISDYAPFLTVYLFGIKIYSKAIKNKGKKKNLFDYLKSLALEHSYANIYYGFDDPSSTGITSGIIRILQVYFRGISIVQYPDFIPEREYVSINAGTNLNIGKTIINYAKVKHLKA